MSHFWEFLLRIAIIPIYFVWRVFVWIAHFIVDSLSDARGRAVKIVGSAIVVFVVGLLVKHLTQ
jgi:hypothetical protein